MTEPTLPEELEEQAMLHALGVLNPEDRQGFLEILQGESELLRQAVRDYQATTGAVTAVVAPVTPPSSLRERLIHHVALAAAREAEQFELAADTLVFGAGPSLKPREVLRDRLLSRIEGESGVLLDRRDAAQVLSDTSPLIRDGRKSEREGHLSQEVGSLSTWMRSCRRAVSNVLRTLLIRSVTSERVRYWKAKIAFQQPTKGLTYIRASEGIWRGIAPGVTAKLLSFDPISNRTTTLLRFAPGTSFAPHRHTAVEELFVLEGGCCIAGREMTVGDYHRAAAGTEHHDTSTDDGCMLLVISSPLNEMLR